MSESQPTGRDEELAALLAANPPRPVPAGLRRAAMEQACPMKVILFFVVLVALGTWLAVHASPPHLGQELKLNRSAGRASGIVVDVRRTRWVAGRRRGSLGVPIYEYDFSFQAAGASAETQGRCYTTGRHWHRGDEAVVEYLAADPAVARLQGARLDVNGSTGLVLLIMPLGGIALLVMLAGKRRLTGRLLTHGDVAEANVTGCEAIVLGGRSRRPGLRITLRRADNPGDRPWTLTSANPRVMAFAQARMESKQPVFVLHDPKRVLLPESLTG